MEKWEKMLVLKMPLEKLKMGEPTAKSVKGKKKPSLW